MKTSMTSALALAVALAVAWPSTARAQQSTSGDPNPPAAPIDAKASSAAPDNDGKLEEVIVTAQKRAEAAQSAPLSISALSGATVQKDRILQLSDLASSTTGISFTANSPQSNEINIRGVVNTRLSSPTADQSVSTFVDDVYVSRSGNLNSAFYDLQRIEIVRGPQGVLLGKNVAGGAINVISAPASFDPSGRVTLTYGNYDHKQASGYLTGGVNDWLALRFSFQGIDHSGYARDILHNVDLENLKSIQGRMQFLVQPQGSDFRANLIYDVSHDESNGINRVAVAALPGLRPWSTARARYGAAIGRTLGPRESLPAWPTFAGDANASPQDVDHKSQSIILKMEKGVGSNAQLTSITGYRHATAYTLYDQAGFAPTNPLNITSTLLFAEPVNFIESDKQFSQELRLASTDKDSRLDWIVGAYFLRIRVNQFNRFWGETQYQPGPAGVPGVSGALPPGALAILSGEAHWNDTGYNTDKAVFAQLGFKLTDTLKIEGGLRYTHDNKHGHQAGISTRTGDRFVPTDTAILTPLAVSYFSTDYGDSWHKVTKQATLTWKPKPDILTYVTYSTGFKGGGFQNDAPNAFAAQTPYNPESVTNWEAGFKTEFFDHRLRANLSAFRMKYRDLQVQQTAAACLCNIINNASSATIKGVEGEVVIAPTRWLRAFANGSYLDAHYNVFVDTNGVNNTGHFLQRTPNRQYAVGAEATLGWGDWKDALTARVSYRYQGTLFWAPDNLNSEDPYGLLDGRLTLKLPKRDWTISGYVKNATNKLYRTNIIAFFGDEASSYAQPRTYGVELGIGF